MADHLGITAPHLGTLISLIPYVVTQYFYKKTNGFFLLVPLFVAMVAGTVLLKVTGTSYDNCKIGGDVINFFLEAATISFTIPFYKKRRVLRKYWLQIFGSIAVGILVALILIYLVVTLFHLGDQISASMLPQAAITTIALPVSDGIGSVKELTSLTVILNTVVISALGGKIMKMFKISNPIARSLALGTSGHAFGVAVTKELGGIRESMGGIAVVIVGVIIVVIVPPLVSLLF